MSKVNTLLKLIAYQKQHPQASDEEIAEGIGLSLRHVIRCKKEVNLLKHQLAEPYLGTGANPSYAVSTESTRTRS